MKIFYPTYYKKFKCIADKCKHSCCIGWEISVDDATLDSYNQLPDAEEILSHISDGEITLCADGRCPFLDKDGLCKIISRHGEEYTSQICQRHPRFYHQVEGRAECGIGASCEEACRLILSRDFGEFYCLEQPDFEFDSSDFDSISHREKIYSLLKSNLSYQEKLLQIAKNYNLPEINENLCDAINSIEYLFEEHRGLFGLTKIDENAENQVYLQRFFAYLIFRHLSQADSEFNLRARLGFCILLTKILENFSADHSSFAGICDFARIISEEIEYSEDNPDSLIFEIECLLD